MTDIEVLQEIIDKIQELIEHHVTTTTPAFRAWKMKANRFLVNKYGSESIEASAFSHTQFRPSDSLPDAVLSCQNGLVTSKLVFESYLREFQESSCNPSTPFIKYNYSKIFIVHGHDSALKESVARVIEKQGIEAIILSEQANLGCTVIEKFEHYSDVGGAICLFTADDLGKAKSDSNEQARARQNVVFEAGYFMGKLGRDHVVILSEADVEIPSDLAGLVYTNAKDWKLDLCKDLKAMGYSIDFNKLF